MANDDKVLEMWALYQYYCAKAPLVDNPLLDEAKEHREVLVNCGCGKEYRLNVNGVIPIPDAPWDEMEVQCPHCSLPIGQVTMMSGHSAGCFNASWLRLVEPNGAQRTT